MQPESLRIENMDSKVLDPQSWVGKYADYLFSYALSRVNDQDLARDLVQETFLAALERQGKFEGRSTEKTWLTSILRNKIVDIYRSESAGFAREQNGNGAEVSESDFFDHTNGHWNDQQRPEEFGIEHADALEKKEFQTILQACMTKLPALWLSVFSMKHLDDQTTEMICRELKLTSSNFWVIIHRTKVNLRSCLQKNWI